MQGLQDAETLDAHDQVVLSTIQAEPGALEPLSPGQKDAKLSEAEATLEGKTSFPEPCPSKNIKKAFPELCAASSALHDRQSPRGGQKLTQQALTFRQRMETSSPCSLSSRTHRKIAGGFGGEGMRLQHLSADTTWSVWTVCNCPQKGPRNQWAALRSSFPGPAGQQRSQAFGWQVSKEGQTDRGL